MGGRRLPIPLAIAAVLVLGLVTWLRSRPGHASTPEAAEATPAPPALAAELAAPVAPPVATSTTKEVAAAELAPSPSTPSAPPTVATPAEDPVQCVVFGRVTGAEGQPIRAWKPWVELSDAHGTKVHAEVDDLGHYSIAGLAPGKWSLACEGTGQRAQHAELELSLREPFVRRDFRLASAARIKVQVIAPDGQPYGKAIKESGGKYTARDLLPVATREPPGASMPEADGLHNDHVGVGNFWDYGPLREGLGPTYLGVVVLDGDPPVCISLLSGVHVLETKRIEPGQCEATFVLDPEEVASRQGMLKLRAVDAGTREPLKGWAFAEGRTGGGPNAALDAAGAWQATLEPGEYDVRVIAEGHERTPRHVSLAAGQELDLGELALESELTIEARVLDGEGHPLAAQEFLIGWHDAELGRVRFDRTSWSSDENGLLRISGLRAERYFLRSYGDDERSYPGRDEPPTVWVSGLIEVSTLAGSVQGLEIRLVGPAELVLKDTDKLPEGCAFQLLDERDARLRGTHFYPGFISRAKVPPGRYTFVLTDAQGAELSRRTLELVAGLNEIYLAR